MAETQDAPNGASAPESNTKEQENQGENWKFIPAQPIREDQVQNAVNFLSHPKVKGSPVVYRRSFLERKGLTREEIDEAFRRVPDPPSDAKPVQPTSTPAVSTPTVVAQTSPSVAPAASPALVQTSAIVPRRRASWTQMVLAIGLLSAAGAGAAVATKQYLFPRMKAWLRRIVLDEEQLEPRKASSNAEAIKATETTVITEMATLMREFMSFKAEERRYYDGVLKSLEAQTLEIKSNLEKQTREMKQSLDSINGYLRRSNSSVSEANGFSSHKALLFDEKTTKLPPEQLTNGSILRPSSAPSAPSAPAAAIPPHSPSYMEVLAMVQRGEKPPGIRDVNDKPPNANQAPSYSVLQPKAKPWEKLDSAIYRNDKVDNSAPWWRQKEENTVKITEIHEDQQQANDSGVFSAGYGVNEAGSSRSWLPPPAPKTILPGVDAAIRPKVPSVEQEIVEPVGEPSGTMSDHSENAPKQVELEEPAE